MLDQIKQIGAELSKGLNKTWESLSEGWRELVSRSNSALTHFASPRTESDLPGGTPTASSHRYPSWSLLAGEVLETDNDVIVRLEVPGMSKEDCDITVAGNNLVISGEKRVQRETVGESYHVMERAYGSFQRVIPLPRNVDPESAKAAYRDGVLSVTLKKTEPGPRRKIVID